MTTGPGRRALGRPAARVIDVHAPFGPSLFGPDLPVAELLGDMARLCIHRSVLVPRKPPGYRFEEALARTAAAASAHRDRLAFWCRVDPWQRQDALRLLSRGLELGACGLFLHPLEELFPINDPLVDPLLELCRLRQVPVMVAGGHVRFSMAHQIAELAARFPAVTLIATSGGQINISGVALGDAERMLADHPNVCMETSGIYREDFVEDMATRFGATRILFGSGAPPFDRDLELRRAEWAHLPDDDRHALLGANAQRILDLAEPGAPRG